MFKQQDSFGPTANTYELQPYGGQSTPSISNGVSGEAPVSAEDERRCKGATVNDQNDMDRLGKTQELRVRFGADIKLLGTQPTNSGALEKLSLPFHLWVLAHAG
jgi:hypothetical protein